MGTHAFVTLSDKGTVTDSLINQNYRLAENKFDDCSDTKIEKVLDDLSNEENKENNLRRTCCTLSVF